MPRIQALLVAALLVFCLAAPASAVTVGSPAPSFSITTLDGKRVDLQHYVHQGPLLLFFWTSWCPYCQTEVHAIQDLKDDYASRGLQVLGINPGWRDSAQRARAFRREQGLDLTLAFDQSSSLGSKFMLQGVPTLFLIDDSGTILFRGYQVTSKLRGIIDRLMNSE